MEILLSWKRKWKQWRGFIRELKRHGIDFYDRNQPDFRTEDGIRQLIEQIALSVEQRIFCSSEEGAGPDQGSEQPD